MIFASIVQQMSDASVDQYFFFAMLRNDLFSTCEDMYFYQESGSNNIES